MEAKIKELESKLETEQILRQQYEAQSIKLAQENKELQSNLEKECAARKAAELKVEVTLQTSRLSFESSTIYSN